MFHWELQPVAAGNPQKFLLEIITKTDKIKEKKKTQTYFFNPISSCPSLKPKIQETVMIPPITNQLIAISW
jgi:hypothetical protein